jgi:O-methyltransferase
VKRLVKSAVRAMGFDIVRYPPQRVPVPLPADLSAEERAIVARVEGYTFTSIERHIALIQAIRYLAKQHIDGCIVECGVWRGGSSMVAALALIQEGETERNLYLYDTFEGMTPPKADDRTTAGVPAKLHLDSYPDKTVSWCVADIDDVRRNMATTGYPEARIHLIKGTIEATIPSQAPTEGIALLRLDTDWYESTKHELVHLFPLLCDGGVLIIDDYGYWQGSKKAVDEYLSGLPQRFYLHRIDDSGRLLVKR